MSSSIKCINCGNYSDLGDCCYECARRDCDRCDKLIPFDEDVSPYDVFGEAYFDDPHCSEFSDGSYNLCEECLTPAETKLLQEHEA